LDQDCSLKNQEPDVPLSWFLNPGGWGKAAAVGLYIIFLESVPCTLKLVRICFHTDLEKFLSNIVKIYLFMCLSVRLLKFLCTVCIPKPEDDKEGIGPLELV
ncbi:hypothetical protein STEG23_019455, partial [Scotinomys teguina]